jgi:hypothetical protein
MICLNQSEHGPVSQSSTWQGRMERDLTCVRVHMESLLICC